jgi:hypothetical protein
VQEDTEQYWSGAPGSAHRKLLAIDRQAESADSSLPAFLAPPPGAPVYHGFPVIEGAAVMEFQLGMITNFLAAPDTAGDAYVIAPDGSRAGLVWASEVPEPYFKQLVPPGDDRWGVWTVGLPLPMTTIDEARDYLAALLPQLRPQWETWRDTVEEPH